VIVTTQHLFTVPGFSKRPGFCRDGARRWARAHGFDWRDFARNGVEAERLEATGDALALALVRHARECEAQEAAAHG
jgi:hypothetical protein